MAQQCNIKEATKNVWGSNPAGWTHAAELKPGTKAFFEKVLHERFSKEHDFLIDIVDYPKWKGKRVLEIGCGAGYDAYMFCKYGADYTGIDLVPENIERTKKHLNLYNLKANILEMDAEKLDFDEKFDLIYSFGVLHHIPNIDVVLKKIKTNLASEGTLQFTVYNKNSWFYWVYLYCYKWLWQQEHTKYSSLEKRLAQIEFTESDSDPYVKVYTKTKTKRILEKNGFKVKNLQIRKLTQEDLPSIRFVWKFYSYIPQSFLNFLAKRWGWYICVEATKV